MHSDSCCRLTGLLLKLKRRIAEYFEFRQEKEPARASDIYDYVKNKPEFRQSIPDSTEFSRFLRKMHDCGLMRQLIKNYEVDTSCHSKYQWRFFPAEKSVPEKTTENDRNEATSHPDAAPGFLPQTKSFKASNGVTVRSKAELYIMNRLLTVRHFDVYYERPLTARGQTRYPDFTIRNKRTNTVFYWEHFGMTDNPAYADGMAEKLAWYRQISYKSIEENGRLIVTRRAVHRRRGTHDSAHGRNYRTVRFSQSVGQREGMTADHSGSLRFILHFSSP